MIKAIIFDLDGTILYSLPDIVEAVNKALVIHGCENVHEKEVKDALGSGVHHLIDTLTNNQSIQTKKLVLKTYETLYEKDTAVYSYPYEGILELLDLIQSHHIKIGVASNKSHVLVKKIVETCFPKYIDSYRGEIKGKPKKPDPEMLIDVMNQLEVTNDSILYIGDSEQDIMAAKALGCKHVAVSYGYRKYEYLKSYQPEHIVKTVNHLKQYIERIIHESH